jgi:Ankyrin repeats (many copies)/Ankyrin repeats (3 copies)
MLHTAAMQNKADCVALLVAEGVSATALDAKGKSALQLACLHSNLDTVQALIDSGGWLDSLAPACILEATIAGNTDILALLIARGVDCTAVIDDIGYTLLHAAAAYGRQSCLNLLLRKGCDVKALTTGGVSVLDVAFGHELPAVFIRDAGKRPEWSDRTKVYCHRELKHVTAEHSEREATAMLLLKLGVDYDASKIIAGDACAVLIKQYLDSVRAQVTQLQQLQLQQLAVHRHTAITASTTAVATASERTASQDHAVQVQLVHAETGEESKHVYTVYTALLAKLQSTTSTTAATNDTDTTPNVLLNMLVPTGQWSLLDDSITTTTAASISIKLLTYDGKRCSSVSSCQFSCTCFNNTRAC